jgi:hypothetical protein
LFDLMGFPFPDQFRNALFNVMTSKAARSLRRENREAAGTPPPAAPCELTRTCWQLNGGKDVDKPVDRIAAPMV